MNGPDDLENSDDSEATEDIDDLGDLGDLGGPDGFEGSEDRAAGETTITRMGLRTGGWIGYNERGVYIDRNEGTRIKIPHGKVTQVALRDVEWDLALMSLLLLGVGAFVATTRNPLIGIGFAVVGSVSLYLTYRKRYELRIDVMNERTPITVYPTYPAECHETLVERIRAGASVED